MNEDDFGGMVGVMVAGIVLVVFIVIIYAFLAALFVVGLGIRWALDQQDLRRQQAAAHPSLRLFNAPPTSQWISTYEYFLYKLQAFTGIDLTTTPGRLFMGAMFISVGPAFSAGLLFALVDPVTGGSWLLALTVVGGVIGGVTGWVLSHPGEGWFSASVSDRAASLRDSFLLGEEEW